MTQDANLTSFTTCKEKNNLTNRAKTAQIFGFRTVPGFLLRTRASVELIEKLAQAYQAQETL